MTDRELFRVRIALLQVFLQDRGYDGILLNRIDNFAMATGGRRNYVPTHTDLGACSLFVTSAGKAYFVGNNIEATRVLAEELDDFICQAKKFLWFEDSAADLVRREFEGTLASDDGSLDVNVNGDLAYLRALLTSRELEKYRRLGGLAAEAMTATIDAVQQGMSEAEIAAILRAEGLKRRCQMPVALIAADDRIEKHRHPLPTEARLLDADTSREKTVEGYVMIVGGFMREGLTCSMTRFVQVGDVPDYVPEAYGNICGVDALMQEASVPGAVLGEVFETAQRAYGDLHFPANEWHNHHQGGTTGYAGRTCKATPGSVFPIHDESWCCKVKDIIGKEIHFGHAFAWNPSAKGVKSEDTVILLPDGRQEIVTRTPDVPNVDLATVLGRETNVAKTDIVKK